MSTHRLASDIGQICRIALPSYPGSGATWYVDSANAPVRITLEQTVTESSPRKAGSQVFALVGEAPGDYELRFVLKRAWENEIRNSRRVVLQVRQAARRGNAH
jgi:predicted secreted protein